MPQQLKKKSIMKLLGIQEMISEYQYHCQKMSQIKKNLIDSNSNKSRNRYTSLIDNENKNQNLANSSNIKNNSYAKQCSEQSFTKNASKTKQQVFFSQKDNKRVKNRQNQIFQAKNKNISSSVNFTKNHEVSITANNRNFTKKTSIKQEQTLINKSLTGANSQFNIKFDPNLNKMKKQYQIGSNYISLKSKLRNTQKPKQPFKIQVDFESSTLSKINKKLKTFERRSFRNQCKDKHDQDFNLQKQNIKFQTLQQRNVQSASAIRQNQRVRISQTIDLNQNIKNHSCYNQKQNSKLVKQQESNSKEQLKRKSTNQQNELMNQVEIKSKKQQKQYVSMSTNYYGFSFKNKVSIRKETPKQQKQSQRQINSTLDKSSNENTKKLQKDQNNQRNSLDHNKDEKNKTVNHNIRMQKTIQSAQGLQKLNKDKNLRYPSTNILSKKKNNTFSLFLKPKLLLKDRYQLIKVIGRGMSGQVYQAKDILSDRFVAIKQINVNSIEYDFFREITHENVIKYYNNFVQNNKRYLVLEYFPMTLRDLLKNTKNKVQLSESNIKHIFKSILNGLSYLHSLSIAHRDIKLDNIEIKFIDFGLCLDLSKMQEGLSKQFCGTLSYLPPQIIQGLAHQAKKADIWSLGIVLYGLAVGRLPYKGKNESEILNKIIKNKLIYPEYFDNDLKDLIQRMLQKNPGKRFTISQILSHQWMDY